MARRNRGTELVEHASLAAVCLMMLNLDEALNIAARVPGARRGTVEVRPVMELAGMPSDK